MNRDHGGRGIHDLVEEQTRLRAGASSILAPGREPSSFKQLGDQSQYVVETLNDLGFGRQDRLALVLPNGPEMAAAMLTVAGAATVAPLPPSAATTEVGQSFARLHIDALITALGFDSAARRVAVELGVPIVELEPAQAGPAGAFSLSGMATTRPMSAGWAGAEDTALVLQTSGTTGQPKVVPLTHRNLLLSASNVAASLQLDEGDRCLNVMPLFHIHGLVAALLGSITAGGSVVCTPGFDAVEFFDWCEEFQPSWYTAVPTIHQRVLAESQARAGPLPSVRLRLIRSSSASLPPPVMTELENRLGVPVIEAYGMTEAAHQITCNPLPPRRRKAGSTGPAAGPEVGIMDEEGQLLEPGRQGEIVIRGPNVTRGYENAPDANRAAFANGWFRTGDLGRLDPDGYLHIEGRLKEIINRGGETIAPREIDEALLEHPEVAQAVAFSIPHPTLGEDVGAAVVTNADATVSERDLQTFLSTRVSESKTPTRIVFVEEIPKGPTGKLQRIGLADKLADLLRQAYVPPSDDLEQKLAVIWAEALGVTEVGIRDNFFQLGGDSLAAVAMFAGMEEAGIALPDESLFDFPTVEEMAASIRGDLVHPAKDPTRASGGERSRLRGVLIGVRNRLLQVLALYAPGLTTTRVWLHRMRGVEIGHGASIGTAALIETAHPELVSIGNDASIGIRAVIIAHVRGSADKARTRGVPTVRIADEAYVGPGAIILPNVAIGRGAVVAAGSVVSSSVPALTLVRGNPALPIARIGVPLTRRVSYETFSVNLRPLESEPGRHDEDR